MDDFLACRRISKENYIYISSLSKQAVEDADAAHLGSTGYFLYESSPSGIEVLAKVMSHESAMRLLELYATSFHSIATLVESQIKKKSVRKPRTSRFQSSQEQVQSTL